MKDIEDFVKTSVDIEFKEESGTYGYYPFHMFVEKKDGHVDIIVIAGVNSVADCYKLMTKYVLESAKRIYMALDFPAMGDMKNDFVAVFVTENTNFDLFAIPYNTIDGTVYERINKGDTLKTICRDLRHVAVNYVIDENTRT